MRTFKLALPLVPLLLFALACDTTTSPPPPSSLLVINTTCFIGSCEPIEVRGFPENQPHTPGGPWSMELGVVEGESACLVLPTADTFRVGGPGETTLYTWTVRDALSLGVQEPGTSAMFAMPSTDGFVPSMADGWSVALPRGGAIAPDETCEPAPDAP